MEEKEIKISFKDTIDKTGLPIVSFSQNDKHFDFIIDTGAEYSVINSNSLESLKYIELEGNGVVYGIEGNEKETTSIGVVLYIDDKEFTEVFQITNVPGMEVVNNMYGTNVIGILGSQFLIRYKFIIDYEKFHIYGESNKIENT